MLRLYHYWATANAEGASLGLRKHMLYIGIIACAFLINAISSSAAADRVGHFEKVYRSTNSVFLTEWGRRYESGEGVVADVGNAIRLYCKAAKQGHADAQYYLGWLYSHGRGVKRDDALAAAWFKQAAARNHPQSRNLLQLLHVAPKSKATCPTSGTVPRRPATVLRRKAPSSALTKLVRGLSSEFNLDPDLVMAVVQVESNYDPNALSPKNGQGLMQLIPETAERFGVTDVWDPEQNLRGGMAYLRWLLDYYDGDVKLVLAAYNAGEGAVDRYKGVPPFGETRDYVRRVTEILGN